MGKKNAGDPAVDPAMPNVTVKIKGELYYLAFTWNALAVADRKLQEVGRSMNLMDLVRWGKMSPLQLEVIFFAALQAAHPKISYEQASGLLTLKNFGRIHEALARAYMESMSDPEDEDANPTGESSVS